MVAMAALLCLPVSAQNVKIKGIYENNRYDDNGKDEKDDVSHYSSVYVGWNYDLGKAIFLVHNGIWAMDWDGNTLSAPAKDPAVNLSDFYSGQISRYGSAYGGSFTDNEKALWASNFNLMHGNSGAVYVDGCVTTVMSRDSESSADEERFAVRNWDAETGNLLSASDNYFPASANLESAGMSYNPVDGKVYGLFYLTAQSLPSEITDDPDFFVDEDGISTSEDAGYCLCSIDLSTMTITPITPGLYYHNFVTFAINSEGRAFALTSGSANGYLDEEDKLVNIDGVHTGAQLCEFDLATGMMLTTPVEAVDEETGETYTAYVNKYSQATGYASQYRRQSACFSKSNPNKMYWNGYFNSGKGYNDSGVWSTLPDKNWLENGKYDTALYEVDITDGSAKRLAKIDNRFVFSCMWVDGDDNSDGATGIENMASEEDSGNVKVYDTSGQLLYSGNKGGMSLRHGLYIVKSGSKAEKVLVK